MAESKERQRAQASSRRPSPVHLPGTAPPSLWSLVRKSGGSVVKLASHVAVW